MLDTPPAPEDPPEGPEDTTGQPLVANMTLRDLLTLAMQLNTRIDTLWQRVIYAHAVMVGVLIFFANPEAAHSFTVPRLLVMFFYTMNSVITFVAFRESYDGLRAIVRQTQGHADANNHVLTWFRNRDFSTHAKRRAGILITLWFVIAYLILYPLISPGGDLFYDAYSPTIPDTTVPSF